MLDCMTRFMNRGKNERSRETHCKSARCSCEIDAATDAEIETPLARNCVSASKHNPRALLMNEDALFEKEKRGTHLWRSFGSLGSVWTKRPAME